jgi:hypothetical protein
MPFDIGKSLWMESIKRNCRKLTRFFRLAFQRFRILINFSLPNIRTKLDTDHLATNMGM